MIPRYTRPQMAQIWAPETRFRIWFEIEAHAASAMAELGLIPKEAAQAIWEKGSKAEFDVARIDAIEREVKHDVIAFLTHLAEHIGPEARFVHLGLTSSDVLDTCFNVQLVRAADLLLADLDTLLAAIRKRAFEHKLTPIIGRCHGIHAEPTTFGLKLAQAYAEFSRAKERLQRARAEVATCAISGAVGTFANVDPRVEAYVAEKMGLAPEPVSTQVIPRDRHAMYFTTLAVIASSMERLATEIRHLQRTEVLEAEEFFSEGQKGSSSMPHKRNPVLTENITGLARMVRAYCLPALENVVLWHERDISHSSAERMIGPDATVTLDFALDRLAGVIEKLVVYPENMTQEPRPPGRPRPFAAGADRAGGQGRLARGRVRAGAAQRHEGVGGRRRFPDLAEGRPRGFQGAARQASSRRCSTSPTTPSTWMRSSPACSQLGRMRRLGRAKRRPNICGYQRLCWVCASLDPTYAQSDAIPARPNHPTPARDLAWNVLGEVLGRSAIGGGIATPTSSMRFLTDGVSTASLIARASRLTIASGAPFGSTTAVHELQSRSASPCSLAVGRLRQYGDAVRPQHRERLHGSALDVRHRRRNLLADEIQPPTHQVLHRLGRAAVGHVRDPCAVDRVEQRRAHVRAGAVTGRPVLQLAIVGLGVGIELGQRARGKVLARDQNACGIRKQRHRREIDGGVV